MATPPWHEPASRTRQSNKKEDRRIGEYPPHLRGMATNRYGGSNLQQEVGLRGNTYGPAGPVRVYTDDERMKYEKELRQRGVLQ